VGGDFIEYTSGVDACDVAREESGSTSKDVVVDRPGTDLMGPEETFVAEKGGGELIVERRSVEKLFSSSGPILISGGDQLPFMVRQIDRKNSKNRL
jgi:hypothetical protein